MRNPQRSYHGTQPNKPIQKTKPISTRSVSGINENEDNNDNEPKSKPHQTIIHNKYWPPSLADIIAFAMLVVTALLMWFTYGLYDSAVNDSKTAETSANAAKSSATISQKTLNAIKDYNTKSLVKQQDALDKSDKANRDNFDRIDKSLRIQDSTLKETQKEFDLENRPFFQIVNITVDTSEKDKIKTKFYIFNAGKQPGRIVSARIYHVITDAEKPFDDDNLEHYKPVEGAYIANGLYREFNGTSTDSPKGILNTNAAKRGEGFILIMGDIIYKSAIGEMQHESIFYYRIKLKPIYDVNTIREDYK